MNFPTIREGESVEDLNVRVAKFREAERKAQQRRRKRSQEMRKLSKEVATQELLYELEQGPYAVGPEGYPELGLGLGRKLALMSQVHNDITLHGEVICIYGQLYFLRYTNGMPGLCSNLMTTVNWQEIIRRCVEDADAKDAVFLDMQYWELIPRIQLLRKYFKSLAKSGINKLTVGAEHDEGI